MGFRGHISDRTADKCAGHSKRGVGASPALRQLPGRWAVALIPAPVVFEFASTRGGFVAAISAADCSYRRIGKCMAKWRQMLDARQLEVQHAQSYPILTPAFVLAGKCLRMAP